MLKFSQLKALFAGFVCMLIYGSVYTYGTLVPYATSYLYHSGVTDITANKMSLLLIISYFVMNVGMPVGNIPLLQFSNRVTTLISIIGIAGSMFLLSLAKSFWLYVLIYAVLFGMFLGYGYLNPIKNAVEHIPEKKGLCSGICIFGFGISSVVFNILLLKLINPDNESADQLPDGRKIFPEHVADNLPSALKICSAVYLGIGLLGILLMTPPKKEEQRVKKEDQDSLVTQNSNQLLLRRQSEPRKVSAVQEQQFDTVKEQLSYLVGHKLIWLIITLACTTPFGIFIAFNYKEYGQTKLTNDTFLTLIGSLGSIFNGVGRVFWGILFDRFSFRIISAVINFLLMGCAIAAPYLVKNQYSYLVVVCIIYFNYGACYSLYPALTMRTFGQVLGGRNYYLVFLGFTIACVVQWMGRLVLVPEDNKYDGFQTCFYIFAGMNLVGMILSLAVKYPPHQQNSKQT